MCFLPTEARARPLKEFQTRHGSCRQSWRTLSSRVDMPSQAHGRWSLCSLCELKILSLIPFFRLARIVHVGHEVLLKLACLDANACRVHASPSTCSVYIGAPAQLYPHHHHRNIKPLAHFTTFLSKQLSYLVLGHHIVIAIFFSFQKNRFLVKLRFSIPSDHLEESQSFHQLPHTMSVPEPTTTK
jgi:hypothetical protein